jgi:lipopolysaccharide transport system ATP-binding protein
MSGENAPVTRVGQALCLRARIECRSPLPSLVVGFMLRDRLGHVVWGTNTWHTGQVVHNLKAGGELEVELRFLNTLGPGSYAFSMALHANETHVDSNYEWQDNLCTFEVVNMDRATFIGVSWIDAVIQVHAAAGASVTSSSLGTLAE